MAKNIRAQPLESRTARAKLKQSGQPYYASIGRGLHLGYRKGQKGGVWVLRRRLDDRYLVETIAAADDHADADGQGVLDWFQAQDRARILASASSAPAQQPSAPLTVAAAMESYLEWLEHNAKSPETARNRAANDILPQLGKRRVDDLTTKELQQWLRALAKRPRHARGKQGQPSRALPAPATDEEQRRRRSTANRTLTVLKAALNHVVAEERAADNKAWRNLKPFPEADAARIRYLKRDECVRLVNAADEHFATLVNAAILTGCRYGELMRLRVHDFNSDAGALHIRTAKSGKGRHVILTHEGTAFFTELCAGRAGDDLMLRKADGSPWGVSHQARPMLAACKGARITPPINFHALRHTYASHAIMDGVPLMIVARNLGHADTRMVEKHYGHLAPDHVAKMIRELSQPFGTVAARNVVPLRSDGGAQ